MNTYVASHLKNMNRQRVYQLIRSSAMTSKAEIAKITGISAPTVIKIVNFLVEKGLVVEIGEMETPLGRRPHMLQVNTELMYAACFVLEGDFLCMGIVDILGKVTYQRNIRVEPEYALVMELLENHLIDQLLAESGVAPEKIFGIGIALPGIYNKETNQFSGAPLVNQEEAFSMTAYMDRLGRKYHAIVMAENDANAQTIGEFQCGGYDIVDDLLFLSAGTGIGAGLIINGKLRRGSHNLCGEIGNSSFDLEYRCRDENTGWLEDTVGHRRIEKDFGVNVIHAGQELSEAVQKEICRYMAGPIALCINNINACLDCQNVVLGGKMVETLGQPLVDEINAYLKKVSKNAVVVRRECSEHVGLLGIAWLLTNKKVKEILLEEE